MASAGIHDHAQWSREQLLDRVHELRSRIRNDTHRTRLADKDEDFDVDPEPLSRETPRLFQTDGRLKQRIDTLKGVAGEARQRLKEAIRDYEERRDERTVGMPQHMRQRFENPDEDYPGWMRRHGLEDDDGF